MRQIGERRPSATTAIAVIGLAIAIGGTAIAGPHESTRAVSAKKVKKIARKQAIAQIDKLVPGLADKRIDERAPGLSVARAGAADSATTAGIAQTAANAANAANAGNAGNAAALQGMPASAFARSESESYHEVNSAGEPPFENGWANRGMGNSTAAFYRDPLGVVHLKGRIFNAADGTVAYTLPAGYRPSQALTLPLAAQGPIAGFALINTGGQLSLVCEGAVECDAGFDGLTFRAP